MLAGEKYDYKVDNSLYRGTDMIDRCLYLFFLIPIDVRIIVTCTHTHIHRYDIYIYNQGVVDKVEVLSPSKI